MDKIRDVENGLEIPLSGGWELTIPIGTFRAPNLTPDKETGIGNLTDAEIARTLRHSVGSDGRYILEFMPFQDISDTDMTAIISFLRSQPAIKHPVKRSKYNFFGKAIFTLMNVQPLGPKGTPPATIAQEATPAYGKYLVYSVANCYGCHTERNLQTGEFVGKDLAGGMLFEPDVFSEGYAYMSPNLTPDTKTGITALWSEEAFVNRFRTGRVHQGSPMPWGAFSRMDETDIRAIYNYLQSLEPVERRIEQIVFAPGEPLPK
jgi:mono/diheme cytochrome c family protein